MFKIYVNVESTSFTGLEALDFARRHELPDTSQITIAPRCTTGVSYYAMADVPESFAREWFGPRTVRSEVTVTADMLSKGDLAAASDGRTHFAGLADLPAERVGALYVAARFAALKNGQ